VINDFGKMSYDKQLKPTSDNSGRMSYETREFVFEDESIGNIEHLIAFMRRNRKRIAPVCDDLLHEAHFFDWLKALGFQKQIGVWREMLRIDPFSFDSTQKMKILLKGIHNDYESIDSICDEPQSRSFIRVKTQDDAKIFMHFLQVVDGESREEYVRRIGPYIDELPLLQVGKIRFDESDYSEAHQRIDFHLDKRFQSLYEGYSITSVVQGLEYRMFHYNNLSRESFRVLLKAQEEGLPLLMKFTFNSKHDGVLLKFLSALLPVECDRRRCELRFTFAMK
jgi:hypothetical protein